MIKIHIKLKRKRRKQKNKKGRKAILIIGVPIILIFLLLCSINWILNDHELSIDAGKVVEYKRAARLADCAWQELVAYDAVRYKNNLKNVNPYVSAVDFLKMYYEIYVMDDGYNWILVSSGMLSTSDEICSWFGISKESDINTIMEAAGRYKKPEFVIQFLPQELDKLISEKQFNEKQIEWVHKLMTSGTLDEMFGNVYELPDYIKSAGKCYFGWPTPELHTITSTFSESRKHPVFGITRPHNGVDIGGENAMGSPVVTIDDGVVIAVNFKDGERGINIKVQHNIADDVWISRYQHLSATKVIVGQQITKGTIIGNVGNSGIGTGPHLHLEITYNSILIDPLPLIQ